MCQKLKQLQKNTKAFVKLPFRGWILLSVLDVILKGISRV